MVNGTKSARHLIDDFTLNRFSQAINDDGRFPAEEAVILWNEPPAGISDVTVSFFPASRIPADHSTWDQWREISLQWDFVFGSITPNWMSGSLARPENVFRYFVSTGFASTGEERHALEQFSKIHECVWARRIAETDGGAEATQS